MTSSVIIPTYNYARYIGMAVQSVLDQQSVAQPPEIIVIDDGSTDETKTVLASYIGAGQVRYHYQPNQGKAAATQKGMELATGEIIFNLDADDYFLPGKIAGTLALFQKHPSLVHVASPAQIIYEDGSGDTTENIPLQLREKLLKGTALLRYFFSNKLLFGGGSSFAAKASVLKQMNWDAAIDMYTDEWLLIKTLLKGDSYLLAKPLSVWRVHGHNYSGTKAADQLLARQLRLERSSLAINQLLQQGDYPGWLQKQYRLKHAVRSMVWKEERGEKRLSDISEFFKKTVLAGHSWSVLQRYHVFNRLLPMSWLRRLKS